MRTFVFSEATTFNSLNRLPENNLLGKTFNLVPETAFHAFAVIHLNQDVKNI